MARKRKPKAEEPAGTAAPPVAARGRSWVGYRTPLKAIAALAAAGLVLWGLTWLGSWAGLNVAGRDRYAVKVADIACDSPPGSDRATFLTEVRYLADLPETVQSVAPDLSERLTAAFGIHPWVAAVEGVDLPPEGGIRLRLRFRVPVLAVSAAGEPGPRAVDGAGVLLPPTTPTEKLARLVPDVPSPMVEAGKPWPDPDVKRAAELAAAYPATRIEKSAQGWRITQPDGKVLVVGW